MFVEAFELAGRDVTTHALALSDHSHLCWLDGATDHGDAGRFSFLACDPIETRVVDAKGSALSDVLDALAQPADNNTTIVGALTTARLPRWVGYVAYDASWSRRDVTTQRHARADQPLLWFARYDAWLAFDHEVGRAHVIGDNREACDRLRDKLRRPTRPLRNDVDPVRASEPATHARAIETALDQIARGDLYQVNLARSFRAALRGDPLALYLAMRAQGAVPFGMYFDAGDHQVLARTMECFLHWDSSTRVLQTRPIKGTIARRGNADAAEALSLRSNAKELAEHTMIVDLMRNDLGRVADVGSVRPTEVMQVEPYAGLSHLVSTVQCTTRADVTLGAIFEATFPPGSVTGTPKLAAIAAIEALEAEPRGIYTGTIGHIDHAGGCHFAVTIRTAVVRDGVATYFAGGGIVEASDPTQEVAETELKARVFVDAVAALRRDRTG